MFLPRFSGDGNPEHWIFRAELYFTYLGFDEKDWVPLPSFYLDGEALTWFIWLFRNKLFLDWKHFKGKFAQRFRQQTYKDVVGHPDNSSQVHFACINSAPVVSQSVVVSPFPAPSHFPESSALESAYETDNSKADHVFVKLPVRDSPHLGYAKSVEGAKLVAEPFSISEDQVFDKISHTVVSSNIHDMKTIVHEVDHSVAIVAKVSDNSLCRAVNLQDNVPLAVLDDTDGSHSDDEENSQGTVTSNVSTRISAIKYPFDGVLWHHIILSWHNSLEEMCGGKQTRVSPYLDFSLRKCNWVDTGQGSNFPCFLLSNLEGCASAEKLQEVIRAIVVSSSMQSPYTRVVKLLFSMFGVVHKARLTSSYIAFDPSPYHDYVVIYAIDSTSRDGKFVEEGAVAILFERPGGTFPIGQVLSVQLGITSNVCNRSDPLILEGTRLMHRYVFIHFPFDPGESVPPSIMFESFNMHLPISNYLSIALYSSVIVLDGTMKGGKLFNEMYNRKVGVQTGQPPLPRPLPKPPFSALILDFLAQVEQSVEVAREINFNGLVIIGGVDFKTNAHLLAANFSRKGKPAAAALAAMLQEWKVLKLRSEYKVELQVVNPTGYPFYGVIEMVDLVARHRLHHGLGHALVYIILLNKCVVAGQVITELNLIRLMSFTGNKEKYGYNWLIAIAIERFGGEGASKTIHWYVKVDNFSFDGSEYVKEYCRYHISSTPGASFDPSSILDVILGIPSSDINTYILAYYVCVPFDREGIEVMEEWGVKGIT